MCTSGNTGIFTVLLHTKIQAFNYILYSQQEFRNLIRKHNNRLATEIRWLVQSQLSRDYILSISGNEVVVVVTFFNHNFVNCKATLILAIKIYGASLLRVAGVTAGLAKSNGSLPPGLWLTSPAGRLPRTGISSGTLRSVIEYGLPFYTPFTFTVAFHTVQPGTYILLGDDVMRRCVVM